MFRFGKDSLGKGSRGTPDGRENEADLAGKAAPRLHRCRYGAARPPDRDPSVKRGDASRPLNGKQEPTQSTAVRAGEPDPPRAGAAERQVPGRGQNFQPCSRITLTIPTQRSWNP